MLVGWGGEGEEEALLGIQPAAGYDAEDAQGEGTTEGEAGDEMEIARRVGSGWGGASSSCRSLTEEALLAAPAVSIALGTAAPVEAGTTLELVGLGILRETPTAPQTWAAKARVTGGEGAPSANDRVDSGIRGRGGFGAEEGARRRGGGLTLLVGHGTLLFDQVVQRGHELRVAADAGEVGLFAAGGGDAGLCCGLLEVVLGQWDFGSCQCSLYLQRTSGARSVVKR